jgi:hypothetical protein
MSCTEVSDKLKAQNKAMCLDHESIASENGKSFNLKNESGKEICRITIDNCLFKDAQHVKCDYAFLSCPPKQAYYVELKGTDVPHAFNQITKTIELTQQLFWLSKSEIIGVIVARGIMPRALTTVSRNKEEFRRKWGNELKIFTENKGEIAI